MEKIRELGEKSEGKKGVLRRIVNISLLKCAVILMAMKVIDVGTTYYALTNLDIQEANPFADYAMSKVGLIPTMIIMLGIYAAVIYRIYTAEHRVKKEKAIVFAIIFMLMFVIDLNNIVWIILLS